MSPLISSALIIRYPLTRRSRSRASCPSRLPSTTRLPIWATKPPRRLVSTRASTRTSLPALGVEQLPVRPRHLRQMIRASPLSHESHEVPDQRGTAQLLSDPQRDRLLRRALDPGPAQKFLESALGGQDLEHPRQLVAHRLEPSRLPRHAEEGLGVAPSRGLLLPHRTAFALLVY